MMINWQCHLVAIILTVVIENARGDTGGAIGIAIHRLHHADALLKDGAH